MAWKRKLLLVGAVLVLFTMAGCSSVGVGDDLRELEGGSGEEINVTVGDGEMATYEFPDGATEEKVELNTVMAKSVKDALNTNGTFTSHSVQATASGERPLAFENSDTRKAWVDVRGDALTKSERNVFYSDGEHYYSNISQVSDYSFNDTHERYWNGSMHPNHIDHSATLNEDDGTQTEYVKVDPYGNHGLGFPTGVSPRDIPLHLSPIFQDNTGNVNGLLLRGETQYREVTEYDGELVAVYEINNYSQWEYSWMDDLDDPMADKKIRRGFPDYYYQSGEGQYNRGSDGTIQGVIYVDEDGMVERYSYWVTDEPVDDVTNVSVPADAYFKKTYEFEYTYDGDVERPEWAENQP